MCTIYSKRQQFSNLELKEDMDSLVLTLSRKLLNKYALCNNCLGRCFGRLGYALTNEQRGEAIKSVLFLDLTALYLDNLKDSSPDLLNSFFDPLQSLQKSMYLPVDLWIQKIQRHTQSSGQDVRPFLEGGFPIIEKNSADEQSCELCSSIFSSLDVFCEDIILSLSSIESQSFLITTHFPAEILEKEKEIQSIVPSSFTETIKIELARELGKRVNSRLGIQPDFDLPHLSIVFSPYKQKMNVEVSIRSVYVYGVYYKFSREIPQTRWPCKKCQPYLKRRFRRRSKKFVYKEKRDSINQVKKKGGCESCNFTGFRYETSVEQEIEKSIVEMTQAGDIILHGGGREDVDVQMLGTGRPCVIEILSPNLRPPTYSLSDLEQAINHSSLIKVELVRFTTRKSVKEVKKHSEHSRKRYLATISHRSEDPHSALYSLKDSLTAKKIFQKTPTRVLHRRSDLVREKEVYDFRITDVNLDSFQAEIICSGGTYIKELISGDDGRTSPSVSSLLEEPSKCLQLDVIAIDMPNLDNIVKNNSP